MIEGDATQVVWWARENENRLNASLDLEQRCCPPAQKEKLAGLVWLAPIMLMYGVCLTTIESTSPLSPIPSRNTHEPALVP